VGGRAKPGHDTWVDVFAGWYKAPASPFYSVSCLTLQPERYCSVTFANGARPMQASFARIDDALIERVFQPLADSAACRTGLDRFRLAAFFLDAASVAWILSQAGTLTEAVTQWDAGAGCLHVLLLLLGLAALTSLRTAFHRVRVSNGANPLRVTMLPHRGVVLALLAARLMALGGFAGTADLAMLGFATCALYLGACATRPPEHGRSRWLAASG
jgi:hypothetical protein